MSEKLRLAIITSDDKLPAWGAIALGSLLSETAFSIALIIDYPHPTPAALDSNKLYHLYRRLDAKIVSESANALRLQSLPNALQSTPRFVVRNQLSDRHLIDISAENIDVMVDFRIHPEEQRLLSPLARLGLWRVHPADERYNADSPPGVWEVLERCPQTGVVIQRFTKPEAEPETLYRSYSRTDNVCIQRNVSNTYWKAAIILPRVLAQLTTLGEADFFQRAHQHYPAPPHAQQAMHHRDIPSNLQMLSLVVRHAARYLGRKIREKVLFEQWLLMFKFDQESSLQVDFPNFISIYPPRDRLWADPMAYSKAGKHYIFIEEMIYAKGRGHISVMEIDAEGRHSTPQPIIAEDYHLSYPFLIEHQDELYLIPESADNRSINLYRCKQFPDQWEKLDNLMDDIEAYDATFHYDGNRWWLFANVSEQEGMPCDDELHIYYRENLLQGEWLPHAQNPVISDVRRARPAGRIYQHEGSLIRPAQYCATRYGYGFTLNRIIELSPESYREEVVKTVMPDWQTRLIATHTLSHHGQLSVIDGKFLRCKFL